MEKVSVQIRWQDAGWSTQQNCHVFLNVTRQGISMYSRSLFGVAHYTMQTQTISTPNCLFGEFVVLPGDELVLWQVTALGGGSGHRLTIDALEMTVWPGASSNCSETPPPYELALNFTCTADETCASRTMTCGVEDVSCFFNCESDSVCRYSTLQCPHNDSLQCGVIGVGSSTIRDTSILGGAGLTTVLCDGWSSCRDA